MEKLEDFLSGNMHRRPPELALGVFVTVEDVSKLGGQQPEDEVGVGRPVGGVDGLEGAAVEDGVHLADEVRLHLEEVAGVDRQSVVGSLKR